MTDPNCPTNAQLAARRKELVPDVHDAFQEFGRQVFADGALDKKTKQLIAVAVAHVTQCHHCIETHTRAALRKGATETELMEAIWVAAEMRAGGAYAHSTLALEVASGMQQEPATAANFSTHAGHEPEVDAPGLITSSPSSTPAAASRRS